MLRAVGETVVGREIVAYRLQQEDGLERSITVDKIEKALRLGKVQISNLELSKYGGVDIKRVSNEDSKKYGLMKEGEFWGIIDKLSRDNIGKAERQLKTALKYTFSIEMSVMFCNRARELAQRLRSTSEGKIAAFMRTVLGRCSDDQITDFIYCVLWAGRDVYYAIIESEDTKQAIKNMMKYIDYLERDGELFGYACSEMIGF